MNVRLDLWLKNSFVGTSNGTHTPFQKVLGSTNFEAAARSINRRKYSLGKLFGCAVTFPNDYYQTQLMARTNVRLVDRRVDASTRRRVDASMRRWVDASMRRGVDASTRRRLFKSTLVQVHACSRPRLVQVHAYSSPRRLCRRGDQWY